MKFVAVAVSLSFVPQLVSPAFARDVSLRWAVGWLVEEAAGDELLGGALEGSRDVMPEGNAAYLVAVIASYTTELESSTGLRQGRLIGEIAARVVAFCAPRVAPPAVVAISIASLGKDAPTRAAAFERAGPAPLKPRGRGGAIREPEDRHVITRPLQRPERARGP